MTDLDRASTDEYQGHDSHIRTALAMLDDNRCGFARHDYDHCASEKFMINSGNRGSGSVVLADDTAIELGSPAHRSVSLLLWTRDIRLVPDGIWVAGRDFSATSSGSSTYAQCIICEVKDGFDPLDLKFQGLKNLANRIPGLMARSLPDRLWIRISKELHGRGFSSNALGQCLYNAHRRHSEYIGNIAVMLAVDSFFNVETLAAIAKDAVTVTSLNMRKKIERDYDFSCDSLNCDICDDRNSCDILKDVVTGRRV